MGKRRMRLLPMLLLVLVWSGTALAQEPTSAFERDRQSILAQAGQFRVHFDTRETVSFQADYDPMEESLSGGSEVVRVLEDTGERISLQHTLVMEHAGQVFVTKHWRQDWIYQPASVLTLVEPGVWRLTPVAEADRAGAWSQTVWHTDDSPRYGAVGRWTYDHGLTQWTSGPTWRPLARRDAARHPVYDRYLGTNRHALRPGGWVHLQDNVKMRPGAEPGDEPVAVVHEDVVNSYDRTTGFSTTPADEYWAATGGYWREVRGLWDAAIQRNGGVRVPSGGVTGAITGEPLMDLADRIQSGEIAQDAAVAQARTIIDEATAP